MVLDLDSLREAPVPYLGWYLEGEAIAGGQPTYRCYASEDLGSNLFQVTVVAASVAGDREARFRAAKDASLALAKGKVFLGTWEHQGDYNARLPLTHEGLPTQEIRNRILRGLFRLYENDFAEDSFQVDLEGVASDLGVTRPAVERALDWLYDAGLIKDHGTFGQNRATGHFWLSSAGAAHVEDTLHSPPDIVGAAPMTSEGDTSFATDRRRVAVVHGRDSRPKEAMFNFLRALGLKPIEWSQAITATGKGTPYNKEAVAQLFKDTQAVVVLMTGDDEAQLRGQFRRTDDDDFESELTPQPRPNVLIELGMAFGIMDARTIIAQVGKLRRMSDLAGLNVIRLSTSATSRKQLAARLKAAGCDLDDSGDDWLTVGDFSPTPPKPPKRRAKKTAHDEDVARRLAQTPKSTIVLGEPVEYPNEYTDRTHLVPDPQYASSGTMRPPLIRTHKERVAYKLYRVPVTSEGGDATNIYVQLAESAPVLQRGLRNPILHLAGDNPPDSVTFIESKGFSLSSGIPREIDVIAITKDPPYRCFIFSVASDDAMEEHDELDGSYVFRLAPFGGDAKDYRVEVDLAQGRLSMMPVASTTSKVGEDFWLEPGAPAFRVDPGVAGATAETVNLLMTFGQLSGDEVTPVIEWSGANVEPSRPPLMPQNQPPAARFQKYQLKPVLARPSPPNDEVNFDIRFRWQGATRQYGWAWPLYVREKGIWGMNNIAGNTLEPKERTTLD